MTPSIVTHTALLAWLTATSLAGTSPAQEPETAPAPAAQDPTRPDPELLRRLGQVPAAPNGAAPLGQRLPVVRVRAVLARAANDARVLLDVDGSDVLAKVGSEFVSQGRPVRVEDAGAGDLRLVVAGFDAPVLVALGLPAALPGAGKLARVDLRAVPLDQASRLLSDLAGLNLAISAQAANQPVSIYLSDVEPLVAVRVLCESHQLWWRQDPATKVVRISTADEYQRDLAELQEERTETFTLHYPNVFDVGRALRELYGDRVVMRQQQQFFDDSLIELSNRLSRFDLFDGRQQGFGQSIGQNGGIGGQGRGGVGTFGGNGVGQGNGLGIGNGLGLGSGGAFAQGNGLGWNGDGGFGNQGNAWPWNGTDPYGANSRPNWTAQQIQRLEQALARLEAGADPKAAQEVQQELAGRTRSPVFVTMAPRQNKLVVRTRDAATLGQIRDLVHDLDVPTALVLLEVRVLGIDDLDGFESFFEYQGADGSLAGQMTTGNIQRAPVGTPGPGGTGLRSGDLIFQYVDATFGARLQLLERENRVHSLATPILLTANNEVSRLFVGKEVPINRSFIGGQTNLNQSTTTTTSGTTNIEFRPVGTTLLMTPSINADRTVTLKIVQEQSNADAVATVLVPSETGFVPQTVNVVSAQTVSGTIVAKSDLAVAFGGLVETATTRQTEQVPLLGDIPLLGMLFRRDVDRQTRREIVIVVKPYVIGTPSEQVGRSRAVLRDLGVDVQRLEPPAKDGEPKPGATLFGEPGKPGFRVHGVDGPNGGGR